MTIEYRAARKKERLEAEAAARAALPPVQEEELERGAMLYVRPRTDGRWIADVRVPDARERDPLLAAGGYRVGTADTAEAATKLGRAMFAALEEGMA